jgi:hypothetical protein
MKAAEAIRPPTRPMELLYTSCRVAPAIKIEDENLKNDDIKCRLCLTCGQDGRHQDHEGQGGHARAQDNKG